MLSTYCLDSTLGTEGTKMTTTLALYNLVLESHISASNYYSLTCAPRGEIKGLYDSSGKQSEVRSGKEREHKELGITALGMFICINPFKPSI